jgi:Ni/Co efflux regulator RcnB
MKNRAVLTAIAAISLSTAGFAVAQGYHDHRERYEQHAQRGDQQDRRDGAARQSDRGDYSRRQYDRRDYGGRQYDRRDARGRANYDARRDGRGAGPNRAFYRGDRLPPQYRQRGYVVENWRGHNLSAPPRGYHWVQTGADYVLVAIATGIILQLMLNH